MDENTAKAVSAISAGGIELVKFLLTLAIEEARRSRLTPEEVGEAFEVAQAEFLANDPGQIPDPA
jgi:hypothetical protein